MTEQPPYVGLAYIAEKLELPIETIRIYHKRAERGRREGKPATSWRMPAPDAPNYVQSRGRPRWRRETADAYVAAKRDKREEATIVEPGERLVTSGGVKLTDEVVEQLADEAERGYDVSQLGERERRDLADEHRDEACEGSGQPVAPRELSGGPVMIRLSKTERTVAERALRVAFSSDRAAEIAAERGLVDALDGPRGWSRAMTPDRADEIAAAFMWAWREHDQPVYELAVRFAEERHPARRTKRGGWAAGVRTGDRTD